MINIQVDGGTPEQRAFVMRTIAQAIAYAGMRPVFPGGEIGAGDPSITLKGGTIARSLLNETVMIAQHTERAQRTISPELFVEVRKFCVSQVRDRPWSAVKDLETFILTGEIPSDTLEGSKE